MRHTFRSVEERTMNILKKKHLWTAIAALLASACGDDTAGSGGSGGDGGALGTTASTTASTTVASTVSSASSTSGTGGSAPIVEVVAAYDPAAFELPEGLAVSGTDAYVGFAFTGLIDRQPLSGGARAPFASVPPPPPNTSFLTGIGFDTAGDLYGALVSFTPDAQAGIYRAPQAGGAATLFASHAQMVFPNGLAWSPSGELYVTDSAFGGVFVVDDAGETSPWFADPLLAGDPTVCGGEPDAIAVGANGIAWSDGALFVAGSDQGVLLRVPIEADGSAGAVEVVAGPDCAALAGLDGIVFDDDGTVVGAVNRSDRIVRIDVETGEVTTIAEGAPLDFPATVAFAGEGEERALYVTSFGLAKYLAGEVPSPALVRIQ